MGDITKNLSELVEYMLAEAPEDSVINVQTQSYGEIRLMLIATTELENQTYGLYIEVEGASPIVDSDDCLHLIILRHVAPNGLISVDDAALLDKLSNEFYCQLLAESDILDTVDNGDVMPVQTVARNAADMSEEAERDSIPAEPVPLPILPTEDVDKLIKSISSLPQYTPLTPLPNDAQEEQQGVEDYEEPIEDMEPGRYSDDSLL